MRTWVVVVQRFVWLTGCVGFLACSEGNRRGSGSSPISFDHSSLPSERLSGEVFFSGEELGAPVRLAVVGKYLVVLEAYTDPAFHVLHLEDREIRGSFGAFGEGPGEFRSPRALDPVRGACCALWVYDIGTARFTHVDLDALLADESTLGDSSITMISDGFPIEPRWLGGKHVVSTGFFANGRLAVFDLNGSAVRWIGELPGDDESVPAHIVQHAYQSSLAVRPDDTMIAVATRHAGRLDIYDAGGDRHVMARVPFPYEPRYETVNAGSRPRMSLFSDSPYGYQDLAATETSIYALFSGRTMEEYGSLRVVFGTVVHVFDWAGNFVKALELDEEILGLTVDPQTGVLYGLRHDPEPAVVVFHRK